MGLVPDQIKNEDYSPTLKTSSNLSHQMNVYVGYVKLI